MDDQKTQRALARLKAMTPQQLQTLADWVESLPDPKPTLNGSRILATWKDAVYVRIPRELSQPIDGGCSCDYCKAHPAEVPHWDTLAVPTGGKPHDYAWTVHAPEGIGKEPKPRKP